ncbi:MAG: hypothetical protein VYA85_09260 [Verrucomicrobiota bacterium]|nr:hypothetical protein [Verrucomicrobiota bacterium]
MITPDRHSMEIRTRSRLRTLKRQSMRQWPSRGPSHYVFMLEAG